jgi:hypothetical protein
MSSAYPEAPSAENALIRVISEQGVTIIHWEFSQQFPEALRFQLAAEVAGYFLKLTGAVGRATSAVHRVGCHEQFKTGACQTQRFFSSGIHYHTVGYFFGAGSYRFLFACHFNEAEAAGGIWLQFISQGAQIGNIDAVVQRHPEELFARTSGYFFAVNSKRYGLHSFGTSLGGDIFTTALY